MSHFRKAIESVRPTITDDLMSYYEEVEEDFRGSAKSQLDRGGTRHGFQ